VLIDTHSHLDFEPFDADRADVLARAAEAGVAAIVIPAVDAASAERALALIAAHRTTAHPNSPRLFAAAGVHPNSTAEAAPDVLERIEMQAGQPGIVAIGEIGLDYHWDFSPKATQWALFEAQLALAARLNLPIIVHNREATDDVLAILESWARGLAGSLAALPGVLHSFSADAAAAQRALACGFMLGFTGPLTYKNADALRHVAAQVPLDRVVIETDAPYLTPTPHRGKRNEPAYVRLVAERLAALHGVSFEAVADATTANARRLYRLPEG
jgi:TatD DNase family protein